MRGERERARWIMHCDAAMTEFVNKGTVINYVTCAQLFFLLALSSKGRGLMRAHSLHWKLCVCSMHVASWGYGWPGHISAGTHGAISSILSLAPPLDSAVDRMHAYPCKAICVQRSARECLCHVAIVVHGQSLWSVTITKRCVRNVHFW